MTKVTICVHLVDATPVRGMLQDAFADLHPDKYWKGGGKGVQFVLSSERLERFVVLDVELCDEDALKSATTQCLFMFLSILELQCRIRLATRKTFLNETT